MGWLLFLDFWYGIVVCFLMVAVYEGSLFSQGWVLMVVCFLRFFGLGVVCLLGAVVSEGGSFP